MKFKGTIDGQDHGLLYIYNIWTSHEPFFVIRRMAEKFVKYNKKQEFSLEEDLRLWLKL